MNNQKPFKYISALLTFLFAFHLILPHISHAQTTQSVLLQDKKHLTHRFGEERYRMFQEKDDAPFQQQPIMEQPSIITDTGDSLNVRLVGRWANGPCEAVAVEGNIAYVGNGAYLEIVDFSDPGNR